MKRFEGKVALVTGAGQGIGYAIAEGLAKEGARGIVINDIEAERAKKAALEIKTLGCNTLSVVADVSREDQVGEMFEALMKEYGRIDILVNNAGIAQIVATEQLSKEDWDKVMGVNVTGVLLCSKFAAQYMMKSGGGKILSLASTAGFTGLPQRAAYCTSKAGVVQLTKVLACEWAKWNINVNAVAPVWIRTDMIVEYFKRGIYSEKDLVGRIPLGRLGDVESVAHAAMFLLSREADFITGITLPIDGGYLAYGYI